MDSDFVQPHVVERESIVKVCIVKIQGGTGKFGVLTTIA
jgi:hypothetical protein